MLYKSGPWVRTSRGIKLITLLSSLGCIQLINSRSLILILYIITMHLFALITLSAAALNGMAASQPTSSDLVERMVPGRNSKNGKQVIADGTIPIVDVTCASQTPQGRPAYPERKYTSNQIKSAMLGGAQVAAKNKQVGDSM